MQDPPAENIRGAKKVTHTVEHRVDWGHVALGIGLLLLAYTLRRMFEKSPDDDGKGEKR